MVKPKVSIVVAAYNANNDYEACLCSFGNQTFKDFETIWVDSNSNDNSVELIRDSFPSVKLIELDYNAGYRGGTNVGAAVAQGDYIVVCNQDVEVDSRWLEEMVRVLEESPKDVGIVAPLIMLYNERNLVNEAGNTFHFSGLYGSRGLNEPREKFTREEEIGTVSGCSFIIRRDLWESLDGFSNDYDCYRTGFHAGVEDLDLCWRARLAGWRVYIAPQSVMYHKYIKKGWSGARLNSLYFSYGLTALRNFQLSSLVLLSPFTCILFLCFWFAALMDSYKTVVMLARTQWWFVSNFFRIFQMRSKVQKTRKVSDYKIMSVMSPTLTVTANNLAQGCFDVLCRCYYSFFRTALGVVSVGR